MGEGALTLGENNAQFHTQMGCDARFDTSMGALRSRTWWVAAVPSASAVVQNVGVAGSDPSATLDTAPAEALSYLQGGHLRLLEPSEVVSLGASGEAALDRSPATDNLIVASDAVGSLAGGGRGFAFDRWFVELPLGHLSRSGFDPACGGNDAVGVEFVLYDDRDGVGDDCDDGDLAVNPDQDELCNDGIDNNCDGSATPCGGFGSLDLSTSLAQWHASSGDDLGESLTALDINGDGRVDPILGAPSADNGVVYLWTGPLAGDQDVTDAATHWSRRRSPGLDGA